MTMPRFIFVQTQENRIAAPPRVKYCDSFLCRLRGLTFRSPVTRDEGLLLVFGRDSRVDSSIHMLGVGFDLAVFWLSGRSIPGEDSDDEDNADERMNFGFSTGDDSIAEPYLYATAYPLPPELPHAELPPGARWQAEGWQGAVFPYAELVGMADAQERVLSFLRGMQDLGERYMTPVSYE